MGCSSKYIFLLEIEVHNIKRKKVIKKAFTTLIALLRDVELDDSYKKVLQALLKKDEYIIDNLIITKLKIIHGTRNKTN